MKARARQMAALMLAAFASLTAWSQARAEERSYSPSHPDFILPEHGLNADIGIGLGEHPRFIGSRENVIDVVPVLEAQWGRDLHLSLDDGLTYTPLHVGPFDFGGVIEFEQDYSSPRFARGLHSDDQWQAGAVARLRTGFGEFEGRLRRSLDDPETDAADLSFDTAVQVSPRWGIAFEARASWADAAFTVPGKRPANAPPVSFAQSADYYSVGVQAAAIYRLSENWRLTALASVDRIVSADDAVVQLSTRNVPNVSLVLTRRFHAY